MLDRIKKIFSICNYSSQSLYYIFYALFMEIIQQITPSLSLNCPSCCQKLQLIQKYQSLITLLKKKADRAHSSHLSQSQKFSVGDLTTSNTSFNATSLLNRYILILTLTKLQQKAKFCGLSQIRAQSYLRRWEKGQCIFNKIQKLCKVKQKACFNKLNQISMDHRPQKIVKSENLFHNQFIQEHLSNVNGSAIRQISQKQLNSLLNKKSAFNQLQNSISLDQLNYKNPGSLHEDFLTSIKNSCPETFKQQSIPLLSKKLSSTSQQINNLYRKVFVLEQQNQAHQIKIKNLQLHMEQALSRQIKEYRKKTQSLQMVAEQMAQKNQIISELQQKITMLQEKYECEANRVLQDQLTQHRKQVQKLQKVNIKLDNQLRKIKQKVAEKQNLLYQLQQQNTLTIKQNIQLQEKIFDLQQTLEIFENHQKNFKASCRKIQKMIQKLKLQQKNIQYSDFYLREPLQQAKKVPLEEFYRLELVFIFLYNIDDESYDFSEHQHLFDEEQLEVLRQLKIKFADIKLKLQTKVDLMQTIPPAQSGFKQLNSHLFQTNLKAEKPNKKNLEDIYCQQNIVDSSIFDVFNGHRQNLSKIQSAAKNSPRIEPEKNLTMKLLQMEIQKNKQIQKISELKQKNMYIRNIILNLMKSLELKQSLLKNQTSGILDLIFDVFEYSQQQKQVMFTQVQQTKQKRFFGLI